MDILVDNCQSAFLHGRVIRDNIILSHELVKGYNRKGVFPRCMMKVDMQNAYDSLEWPFLEQILCSLNFRDIFVQWVMDCVSSVSYSIIINGKPSVPFPARKGLRQGDPLSRFLFVLAMEYLNRLLKTLRSNPDFNFPPKCDKLQIYSLGLLMTFSCSLEGVLCQLNFFSTASTISLRLQDLEQILIRAQCILGVLEEIHSWKF